MNPGVLLVDLPALAARLRTRAAGASRVVVGLCGAPGAGKSTLAGLLADELNRDAVGTAVVVPMDGFHLAASVIAGDARASRRGAPDTFDPGRLRRAAGAGCARTPRNRWCTRPEYRREIEDPVAGAIAVPA